jgi:hypothetical protein
MGGSGAAT